MPAREPRNGTLRPGSRRCLHRGWLNVAIATRHRTIGPLEARFGSCIGTNSESNPICALPAVENPHRPPPRPWLTVVIDSRQRLSYRAVMSSASSITAALSPTLSSRERHDVLRHGPGCSTPPLQRSGSPALRGADVSTIAAAVGVARGTFYFHFPTKEHVVVEAERPKRPRSSPNSARDGRS